MSMARVMEYYDLVADAPDAVEKLRGFIADLAVQGRLTERDGEEARAPKGSAELGPAEWRRARLGSIAEKITDGTHKTPTYLSAGVHFVSVKDFSSGKLSLDHTRFISPAEHRELYRRCDPRRGDILLARIGTLGRAVIVDTDIEFSLFVSVALIRPRTSEVTPQFLRLYLNSPTADAEYRRIMVGGGTHTSKLNLRDLHEISIPVPPIAEQHRIVAKVDELTALCDQLEASRAAREAKRERFTIATFGRLTSADSEPSQFREDARLALESLAPLTARVEQISQLRRTVLDLAVRGRLVKPAAPVASLSKRTELSRAVDSSRERFEIPASWRWVSVRDVAETRLGKMLDKSKNRGEMRRYLRNSNVRWFDFDLSDVSEMRFEDSELAEFALVVGDVLICEGGEPGRAAVWDGREPGIFFQKAIHRARFIDAVNPHYFALCLRVGANDGSLAEYFTGTGIQHFTGRSLSEFSFPLPQRSEQDRIVAKVATQMAVCDQLERRVHSVSQLQNRLFEAVLTDAVRGS